MKTRHPRDNVFIALSHYHGAAVHGFVHLHHELPQVDLRWGSDHVCWWPRQAPHPWWCGSCRPSVCRTDGSGCTWWASPSPVAGRWWWRCPEEYIRWPFRWTTPQPRCIKGSHNGKYTMSLCILAKVKKAMLHPIKLQVIGEKLPSVEGEVSQREGRSSRTIMLNSKKFSTNSSVPC